MELEGVGLPDFQGYLDSKPKRVIHEDALALGEGLDKGLDLVPEDTLPLQGGPFGEENTVQLLGRAAKGEIPMPDEVTTAIEILSGPPRAEAKSLAAFLLRGEFTLNPRTGSDG